MDYSTKKKKKKDDSETYYRKIRIYTYVPVQVFLIVLGCPKRILL